MRKALCQRLEVHERDLPELSERVVMISSIVGPAVTAGYHSFRSPVNAPGVRIHVPFSISYCITVCVDSREYRTPSATVVGKRSSSPISRRRGSVLKYVISGVVRLLRYRAEGNIAWPSIVNEDGRLSSQHIVGMELAD